MPPEGSQQAGFPVDARENEHKSRDRGILDALSRDSEVRAGHQAKSKGKYICLGGGHSGGQENNAPTWERVRRARDPLFV